MSRRFHIKDVALARSGSSKVAWAERQMPVLLRIRSRVARTKPLRGIRIACCLHVTTETAHLMLTLQAGGADLALCASNPLSTQDDVAAALAVLHGIPTFAVKGEDNDTYYRHINTALDHRPNLTMDDGADLVATLHRSRTELLDGVIGGSEETTT